MYTPGLVANSLAGAAMPLVHSGPNGEGDSKDQSVIVLGANSPFFSGILLSRKPPKTLGKWLAFESMGNQPLELCLGFSIGMENRIGHPKGQDKTSPSVCAWTLHVQGYIKTRNHHLKGKEGLIWQPLSDIAVLGGSASLF